MKTMCRLCSLVLVLVSAAFLGAEPVPAKPAPDWTLPDLAGGSVSFAQFKGKVVVVDFWATWCGPCVKEIPGYIALREKYGKDGLVIIGISLDRRGPESVMKFVAKHGMNYTVLMGDAAVVEAFGNFDAIPTTFIIDRAGKIRERKTGAMPAADFEKLVLQYL